MAAKPTYEELLEKVRQFEEEVEKRKRAEIALRASEARLVESLKEDYFLYSIDLSGSVTYVSPTVKNVLGYSQDDFISQYPEILTDNPVNKIIKQYIESGFQKKVQSSYEVELLNIGGKVQWLETTGVPVFDPNKAIVSVEIIAHDITERKLAEESLEKYKHIVSASHELMTFVNRDYIYQAANDAYLTAHGKKLNELIGHQMADVLGQEPFSEIVKEKIDRAFSGEQVDFETWFDFAGIGRKYLEVSYYPFFEQEDYISGVVINSRDITERKKTEDGLRQAQKMEAIGTMAGGIAHDFNNILSVIIGYAKYTLSEVQEYSEAQHNLENIIKAGNRAANLVNQILSFSRQSELERKPRKLQILIRDSLNLLRETLPSTIKIIKQIDDNCGPVLADSTQINQVIINLCTNAHHAMRKYGGELLISLKEVTVSSEFTEKHTELTPGKYAVLSVKDTGHGMNAEIMNRIYDPYFTTKKLGEGTGMGLATVHGIVRGHEGIITVENNLSGSGTTFKVYFPLIVHQKIIEPKEIEGSVHPISSTGSVLFVDDEEMIVRLSRRVLEKSGFQVEAFTDSAKALKEFQSDPDKFDIVVTDQTMPGLTGVDLAQSILGIRKNIPIILCTGFSENVDENQAKEVGIKEFVLKPIAPNDLARKINEILHNNVYG